MKTKFETFIWPVLNGKSGKANANEKNKNKNNTKQ